MSFTHPALKDYYDPSVSLAASVDAELRYLGIERSFVHDAALEKRYLQERRSFADTARVNTDRVIFHATPTHVIFEEAAAHKAVAEMRELGLEDVAIRDWLNTIGESFREWCATDRKQPFPDKETIIFIPPDVEVVPTRHELGDGTAIYCMGAGIPFGQSVTAMNKYYACLVVEMFNHMTEDLKATERPFYFAYHVTKDSTMYLLIV